VPYLSISTSEPVTFNGGEVIGRNGKSGASGPTTESGLGDIVVQDEFYFVQGTTHLPWLSALALLKLPTADESAGLGTGRTDYGPGAAITQPLGAKISVTADARYWVRGSPSGVVYQNTLWTSAGVRVRLSEATALNFVYDDRQSIVPGRRDLRDVSLGYDRRLSKAVIFRGAVFVGLSTTAEDYGFSAGFSFGRN
jgi:outer membrane putative beta-barrel porin/alpha-amylase